MQQMEDKLQGLNSRIHETKERLKGEMADLERLRSIEKEKLTELELMGKEAGEEEDPTVGGLYDWYGIANYPLSVSPLIWITRRQVRVLLVDLPHSVLSQVHTCRVRKRAAINIFNRSATRLGVS